MRLPSMVSKALQAACRKHPPSDGGNREWTSFMKWLGYANAGMLTHGNLFAWRYAVRNLPSSSPIVEIGSFCGMSTNFIAYFLRESGRKNAFFTCDKWVFEGEGGGPEDRLAQGCDISVSEYRKFVRDSFVRGVEFFSSDNKPFAIEEFSDGFFELWRTNSTAREVFGREVKLGGPISFCFIDGNHSYEYAKRDFENCHQFLEPGGFVLLDDSGDFLDWAPNRVAKEALRRGGYRLVSRNPNYLLQRTR